MYSTEASQTRSPDLTRQLPDVHLSDMLRVFWPTLGNATGYEPRKASHFKLTLGSIRLEAIMRG